MPLILAPFHGTNVNITSELLLTGELNLQKTCRFGIGLTFEAFGSGTGTMTFRIEFLAGTTSFGSHSQTFSRSPSAAGCFRYDLPDTFFLPSFLKAKFYLTSSNGSDTGITVHGDAYDVNYPTVDAEFRDSESVPDLSAVEYVSGRAIGTQMTFNVVANRGSIVACRVLDKNKNPDPLELWLFRASTTGTGLGNNVAFQPSDTQLANLAGVIRINDWFAAVDNSIGQPNNLPLSFTDLSNGALYAWLVSRDSPTYASSSDLSVQLEALKD